MDPRPRRDVLGDTFVSGRGIEVGAGLLPSMWKNVTDLIFIDKRSKMELEELFKTDIPYEIADMNSLPAEAADFLVAHHVLEHSSNPIRTLLEWSLLVREGGRIYVSIPSHDNFCESLRLPTPFSHVFEDFVLERHADHFDSKLHVPLFIAQWTAMDEQSFWYTKQGVKVFSEEMLSEARRDGNDCHWHTFTLDVVKQVAEAALWFAGAGVEWIIAEHSGGEHHLIIDKVVRGKPPGFLVEAAQALTRPIQALDLAGLSANSGPVIA